MSMIMHVADSNSGELRPYHKHFYVERPGSILVIGQQLKPKTRYSCLLRNISVAGAMLDFNPAIILPKQFFLQIHGFGEEIGSSQVYRHGTQLGVRFNVLLPRTFVSRLIRMEYTSSGI